MVSTELRWISDYKTCRLVTMAKVYSGLRSLTFCSSIRVFVGGNSVCKMIPNSSFCFICCMVLIVAWFGLHFLIRVYCLECAMLVLRVGYLF